MDALDGLKALEQMVETIGEDLDDLYQRRDIPQIERVTLYFLKWALAYLADDLHTMDTEVKDLRLSVAAARTLDLQRLGDMSRIAKERDAARAQVAELTKKVGELPAEQVEPVEPGPAAAVGAVLPWSHWKFGTRLVKWPMRTEIVERGIRTMPDNGQSSDVFRIVGNTRWFDLSHLYSIGWREDAGATQPDPLGESPIAQKEPPEWHRWKHGTKLFHPRHPDIVRCVHDATAEDMERWYRGGWRELVEPEPASESYQWQVGDEVINRGELRAVDVVSEGWIKLDGLFSCCRQTTWERAGYKLHCKASDSPATPGTDGEGQS